MWGHEGHRLCTQGLVQGKQVTDEGAGSADLALLACDRLLVRAPSAASDIHPPASAETGAAQLERVVRI